MKKEIIIITGLLLYLLPGCSNETTPDEERPIRIEAEINSYVTRSLTLQNDYDRSSFVNTDKIRITKSRNGVAQTPVDYQYNGTGWNAAGAEVLTLDGAATYQARYPAEYTSIRQNQSTAEAYRMSNLLETSAVTSRNGTVAFTNNAAFQHKNTKITLKFQVPASNPALTGSLNFSIQGAGLLSGISDQEIVTLFRPDTDQYTWCGIVYPKKTSTRLKIVLLYGEVEYPLEITCPLAEATHYIYTLTVHNTILVPVSNEIKPWNTESIEETLTQNP